MNAKSNERMEQGRKWLRLVRADGDAETKRAYLEGKGFTKSELDELLEWDRLDQSAVAPLS